jgi:hypothetical protein
MTKSLSEHDYVSAATILGVELAAVKAVCEVESRGKGFLPTGEPVILFERHWMHRLMRRKGLTPPQNSPVAMIKSGGYVGGLGEHKRLQEAVKLDRDSALQSCSWGLFQIMGFHYEALGYPSIQHFVNAMYRDEASQLDAFVRFIQKDRRMHNALKNKDWVLFATAYNGPAHAKNNYAPKMAAAYKKYRGE